MVAWLHMQSEIKHYIFPNYSQQLLIAKHNGHTTVSKALNFCSSCKVTHFYFITTYTKLHFLQLSQSQREAEVKQVLAVFDALFTVESELENVGNYRKPAVEALRDLLYQSLTAF